MKEKEKVCSCPIVNNQDKTATRYGFPKQPNPATSLNKYNCKMICVNEPNEGKTFIESHLGTVSV